MEKRMMQSRPWWGYPVLLQMGLGAIFLDDLSNLNDRDRRLMAQRDPADKAKGEGGKPPINGSEGDVPEYIKKRIHIRVDVDIKGRRAFD